MRQLILYRGLPGSGKTTAARQKCGEACASADDYFERPDGSYDFDPTLLSAAHGACLARTRALMGAGHPRVGVHNTFTQAWEMAPYVAAAREYGYDLRVVHCTGEFGSVHGVPEDTIARMRERWEPWPGEIPWYMEEK